MGFWYVGFVVYIRSLEGEIQEIQESQDETKGRRKNVECVKAFVSSSVFAFCRLPPLIVETIPELLIASKWPPKPRSFKCPQLLSVCFCVFSSGAVGSAESSEPDSRDDDHAISGGLCAATQAHTGQCAQARTASVRSASCLEAGLGLNRKLVVT